MSLLDITVDGNLTSLTSPSSSDRTLVVKSSDGNLYDVTLEELLKVLNGLAEDSSPDASDTTLTYDVSAGTVKKTKIQNIQLGVPYSFSGLNLSNNNTDPNNDIDIATGAAFDSTGARYLRFTSALTKRLDATFVSGTGQGMLDTGAKANNTWYHIFLIGKTDGTVDLLASTSYASPTLPSGYTFKRRRGSIRTDGSGNIMGFLNTERKWFLKTPVMDVSGTITTTRGNHTLTVPSGLQTLVLVNIYAEHASAFPAIYLSNPNLTDSAPSTTAAPLGVMRATSATSFLGQAWQLTDASSQISSRSENTSTTLRLVTLGWEELE